MQESDRGEHAQHQHTPPGPPPSSWGMLYPEGDLVSVIDARDEADRAVRSLEAAGVPADHIFLVDGRQVIATTEDFRQHQNVAGRLGRVISFLLSDSARYEQEYLEEARLEHHLIVVRAPTTEEVDRALPILRAHGAHHIRHYGQLTVDDFR